MEQSPRQRVIELFEKHRAAPGAPHDETQLISLASLRNQTRAGPGWQVLVIADFVVLLLAPPKQPGRFPRRPATAARPSSALKPSPAEPHPTETADAPGRRGREGIRCAAKGTQEDSQ